MEKKDNKSILLIVLLVLVGLTSGYVSSTYAKYTSTIEKESTATIAKWSFDTENANTDLDMNFAKTYNPSTLVANRIAPGTEGAFSLKLTNKDTETGVDYSITFNETTGVPTNLKFYEDAAFQNEIDVATDKITGSLAAGDATGDTVNFYWKWAYETVNGDEADTTDGSAGGDLVLKAKITGTQQTPQ